MTQKTIIRTIRQAIESDPNKAYVKSLSLFGSVLHGDARPDSDVDLLVELEKPLGFFRLVEIQQNLEKKLGRRVDLVTKQSLSKQFRQTVLNEAKKVYDQT